MSPAESERLRAFAVVAVALVLAVPLGILAATDLRFLVVAGVAAAAAGVATTRWFRRDPVMVLLALWVFQVVRIPLAAGVGSLPGTGFVINQLTDLCLLVVLLSVALDAINPSVARRDLRYFWPAVGLAVCGLVGSVLQGAPPGPTLVGLWLATKLWLLVAVAGAIDWRPHDLDRVMRVVVSLGAVTAVLGIVDAVTGGAVADAFRTNVEVTQFAYRTNAAQSVYGHPNQYSLAMCLLVALWLARIMTRARVSARDIGLLVLFVAAAIVSLRLKAVLSIGAVFAIVAAMHLRRERRHVPKVLAGGAVVVALAFVFMGDVIKQQFETYTSSATTPRAQLYRAGAQIAVDHLPFGVGFGRFGSAPSREHYSSVYDDYQLSRTWGLSRAYPRFIADTSWPAILGETGVAGLLIFVAGLLALLGAAITALRLARGPDRFAPLATIAVLAVIVVDSTGSPTLFMWNASTVLALVAGATISQRRAELVHQRAALAAARRQPRARARARQPSSRPLGVGER